MNNTPALTVYMGVYNRTNFLEEAIESILNQTFSDFELLIIDDGSTDTSFMEIIKKYKDPRIRFLQNEKNRGIAYTRNRGLKEARGKYIALLDSDDIAMPDRLQIQYDFMESNPQIALCGGQAVGIDANGKFLHKIKVECLRGKELASYLFFGNMFVNSSIMMRLDMVKQVGEYRSGVPEDYHMHVRVANKFEVINLKNFLVKKRYHEGNFEKHGPEYSSQSGFIPILKYMQTRLGMNPTKESLDLHYGMLYQPSDKYTIEQYENFLKSVRDANNKISKYDERVFDKILNERWFSVVRVVGGKSAFIRFFKSDLLKIRYITFKQIRRTLKKSFFSLLGVKY